MLVDMVLVELEVLFLYVVFFFFVSQEFFLGEGIFLGVVRVYFFEVFQRQQFWIFQKVCIGSFDKCNLNFLVKCVDGLGVGLLKCSGLFCFMV